MHVRDRDFQTIKYTDINLEKFSIELKTNNHPHPMYGVAYPIALFDKHHIILTLLHALMTG